MKLSSRAARHVDYDLHGIVGIRLLNPSDRDVAAVNRQLGPIRKPFDRAPDITIRFVDELPLSSRLQYLGVDNVGFTDDAFVMLQGKHKSHVRVRIPFEKIGGRCEIVCESGVSAVPLLIPIVNLTALANGSIPLHAAAFNYRGAGVVTTGWSKGGKTETLLAFVTRGAEYVGDEWVYISGDGSRMHGIPEPLTVWDWHLRQLPQFRAKVGAQHKLRLRALGAAVSMLDHAVTNRTARKILPSGTLSRVLPILKRQLHVNLSPEQAFGGSCGPMSGSPETIVFVGNHESNEVTVQPMSPDEIAERMVFSLQEERMRLTSYYLQFRFAFPHLANPFIEQAEQLQRDMLTRALRGKRGFGVFHPYPVQIQSLFDAIEPLL